MTRIKTIIMSALVAAMASTIPASAASPYRGEKSMGIYAGYATRNESATAGIYFQIPLRPLLQDSPLGRI